MIATILPSSTNFHAVEYNEMKVAMGKAELIEMYNFGYIEDMGCQSPEELTNYLVAYSSANQRIKKAQFHLAISCKGNEYSQEELVRIAHQYLKDMGYGEPGQPLLIYAHHDTDNNHIHIITSRVNPHGKKIYHNHERLHSQEVINRIMGVDEKQRVGKAVTDALHYSFSTIPHFKAIMETMGYECFEANDELVFKRGGFIQDRVKLEVVEAAFKKYNGQDRKRIMQVRAILKKYRDMSSNKEELQDMMKSKFGINLFFLGSKDSPYGYIIVDHHHKEVYKGGDVLKLKEMLNFQTNEERFKNIGSFIDKLLDDDVFLTTKELNRMLRRQFGCKLTNGSVLFNGASYQIPEYMTLRLKKNDKRAWLQTFNPSTEEERNILCSVGKYYHPEHIILTEKSEESIRKTKDSLQTIFNQLSGQELWDKLHEDGYVIIKKGEEYYCVDFAHRIILNMSRYGLDISCLKYKTESTNIKGVELPILPKIIVLPEKIINKKGGSADSNREWEVGKNGYDDTDDERKIKR